MSKLLGQTSRASGGEKFGERARRGHGFQRNCSIQIDREDDALGPSRRAFGRHFDQRRRGMRQADGLMDARRNRNEHISVNVGDLPNAEITRCCCRSVREVSNEFELDDDLSFLSAGAPPPSGCPGANTPSFS